MSDAITPYAVHKFGSTTARPRITGVYAGAGGWTKPSIADDRLTRTTAEHLRGRGYTMVRVRWRFSTHEVILRRYLGE